MSTVLQAKQPRLSEWLSEPAIHVASKQPRPRATNSLQRRALSTPQLLTVASHRSLMINTAYSSSSLAAASAPRRGLASSPTLARSASQASQQASQASLRSRRQRSNHRLQQQRTHSNFGYSMSLLERYGVSAPQVAQQLAGGRPKSAPVGGRPIFGEKRIALELAFGHVVQRAIGKQGAARELSAQDRLHQVTMPVAPHNYSAQVGMSFDEHGSWRNYELRELRKARGVDDRQLLETIDLHGNPLRPAAAVVQQRTLPPQGHQRRAALTRPLAGAVTAPTVLEAGRIAAERGEKARAMDVPGEKVANAEGAPRPPGGGVLVERGVGDGNAERWGGEGGERPGEGVVASQPSSVPRLPLRRPQSAGVARESGARGGPGEGRGPGGFSAMAAAGRAQRPASASASRHVPSSQQLAGSRPSSAGSSREASVRQIFLS
jgi:hypothetical protein